MNTSLTREQHERRTTRLQKKLSKQLEHEEELVAIMTEMLPWDGADIEDLFGSDEDKDVLSKEDS